jgi:hypothetical protein
MELNSTGILVQYIYISNKSHPPKVNTSNEPHAVYLYPSITAVKRITEYTERIIQPRMCTHSSLLVLAGESRMRGKYDGSSGGCGLFEE